MWLKVMQNYLPDYSKITNLYCRYVYINLVAKLVDMEMEILYYSYLHIGF